MYATMSLRKSIYLDFAATTPVLPQVRAAMAGAYESWANPSSPHGPGRAARAALEDARARVAAALGWNGAVIFTSGATEALGLAIGHSLLPLTHVSDVEHDAVLRVAGTAQRWGVNADGIAGRAAASGYGLVGIQHVNNETGVIQPLGELATLVRGGGGLLLADCAQSAGKLALPDADIIAVSAHKFGGPVGIGALLVRDFGLLRPVGGQERGYRAGTENLPAAIGMAVALEADRAWLDRAEQLRARLEKCVEAASGLVVAKHAPRIATIGAYRMPGRAATVQMIRLDAMGIAVSAGSACSSGSLKTSHVLRAMAYDGADEVIRVSIGRETGADDIDAFVQAWAHIAGAGA